MIENILENFLKTSALPVDWEEQMNALVGVITNMRPVEAIVLTHVLVAFSYDTLGEMAKLNLSDESYESPIEEMVSAMNVMEKTLETSIKHSSSVLSYIRNSIKKYIDKKTH